MRNNTQRIYERLSRGEFLSVDSADTSVRHLYEDIEENLEDYTEYFKEITDDRAEIGQLFKMA